MNKERAKELLEIELKCISRADTCNRDCGKCDLVQDTDELKVVYKWVIKRLAIYKGIAERYNIDYDED